MCYPAICKHHALSIVKPLVTTSVRCWHQSYPLQAPRHHSDSVQSRRRRMCSCCHWASKEASISASTQARPQGFRKLQSAPTLCCVGCTCCTIYSTPETTYAAEHRRTLAEARLPCGLRAPRRLIKSFSRVDWATQEPSD